jgi:hypothetical protein
MSRTTFQHQDQDVLNTILAGMRTTLHRANSKSSPATSTAEVPVLKLYNPTKESRVAEGLRTAGEVMNLDE